MNLEHYKNFLMIVDAGSLSAAVQKLHIAQSELSTQLKLFENKFGAELIVAKRGVRKIKLTEAGKILYEKSKYICQLDDLVMQEIDALQHGTLGTLRISLSPSMSLEFIEEWLSGFSKAYPNVHYELYEVGIAELESQLLNGLTEIGIARAPLCNPAEFDIVYKSHDSLMLVYPRDQQGIIDNQEQEMPLIALKDVPINLSRGCLETFKEVCADLRFVPKIQSVNTTKTSTIIWAQNGAGVAIVPVSKEEKLGDNMCSRILDHPRLRIQKTVIAVKNRELSHVAQLFLDYCKKMDLKWDKME